MSHIQPRLILLLVALAASEAVLFSTLYDSSQKLPSGAALAIAGEDEKPLPPEPVLQAEAYLVKIIGEEEPLAMRREKKPLPPASITKVLTALVAREEIPPGERIVFSEEAKATEEKMSGFGAGTELELEDMLKLALVMSANDAARALAEAVGKRWGGINFEERMQIFGAVANQKARKISMTHSYFENPTGLDGNLHLASAEDLAVLGEYVWLNYPELWEITRSYEAVIAAADNTASVSNTNKLLEEFPAFLGGKTGFTDNAKETFLFLYPVRRHPDSNRDADALAHRTSNGVNPFSSGKIAVVALLGSNDRFEDARKIIEWLESL